MIQNVFYRHVANASNRSDIENDVDQSFYDIWFFLHPSNAGTKETIATPDLKTQMIAFLKI